MPDEHFDQLTTRLHDTVMSLKKLTGWPTPDYLKDHGLTQDTLRNRYPSSMARLPHETQNTYNSRFEALVWLLQGPTDGPDFDIRLRIFRFFNSRVHEQVSFAAQDPESHLSTQDARQVIEEPVRRFVAFVAKYQPHLLFDFQLQEAKAPQAAQEMDEKDLPEEVGELLELARIIPHAQDVASVREEHERYASQGLVSPTFFSDLIHMSGSPIFRARRNQANSNTHNGSISPDGEKLPPFGDRFVFTIVDGIVEDLLPNVDGFGHAHFPNPIPRSTRNLFAQVVRSVQQAGGILSEPGRELLATFA